jgi:hypothetical protein
MAATTGRAERAFTTPSLPSPCRVYVEEHSLDYIAAIHFPASLKAPSDLMSQ